MLPSQSGESPPSNEMEENLCTTLCALLFSSRLKLAYLYYINPENVVTRQREPLETWLVVR